MNIRFEFARASAHIESILRELGVGVSGTSYVLSSIELSSFFLKNPPGWVSDEGDWEHLATDFFREFFKYYKATCGYDFSGVPIHYVDDLEGPRDIRLVLSSNGEILPEQQED